MPPGAIDGVDSATCGSDVLLKLGLLFNRTIVVVAPAVAEPWFFTTTVTVSVPPAVSEPLLSDML